MKHTWENAAFSCGTERGMGIVWKYNPLINNIEARKKTHTHTMIIHGGGFTVQYKSLHDL